MANPFHDHLDECLQCRENPFNLCLEGADLLKKEATAWRDGIGKQVKAIENITSEDWRTWVK